MVTEANQLQIDFSVKFFEESPKHLDRKMPSNTIATDKTILEIALN